MSENLGFLTVIGQPYSGLTGGYLVLNRAGRPLEFHCTLPLEPDRIQQILYGETLQPFLYGEKIAKTLIQRSKLPILTVLTNISAVLPVFPLVSTPVAYVFGSQNKQETAENSEKTVQTREISSELNESLKEFGIDNSNLQAREEYDTEEHQVPQVPGFDTALWRAVRIGNRSIAIPEIDNYDSENLITEIKNVARTIDLLEPFARIRRALEEASMNSSI